MAQKGILKMFDVTRGEYYWLIQNNRKVFAESGNWFHVANDSKPSFGARVIYCYKKGFNNKFYSANSPDNFFGAAVLLLNKPCQNGLEKLNAVLARECDLKYPFLLKNGVPAFLSFIRWYDDTEKLIIAIPNVLREENDVSAYMNLPFSLKEKNTYSEASKEKGTLPYMVENNEIVELLPEHIKEILEIQTNKTEKIDPDNALEQ
ncbi:MAG: hypothetical protein AB7S44_01660 [Spirochaetales bacterium]